MAKIISGIIIEKSQALTLDEFCNAIHSEPQLITKMIEYQLLHPEGNEPSEWRFDSVSIKKGRIAASFYYDLEINLQGIALALQLLDQNEQLQKKIDILENK
ncbi:MAG: chaperone modulatory protein CbpM [Proteobacteria bacterium]|nr:chaperone modulatory protein CbpM [Pseudomonadota bacterium]